MMNINTKTFYKLSYGLYVIASEKEGKLNGQIANTVFQISSDPATVAISINRKNLQY
jgi:flavin reductase (DIM6/NTAB) family NADH-FMN oxidoreductase RutF